MTNNTELLQRQVSEWQTEVRRLQGLIAIAMENSAPPSSPQQQLIDVGTGKIAHIYGGECPDELEGRDTRDSECPACQVLTCAAQAAKKSDEEIIETFLADKARLHVNLMWLPYPRLEALHLAGATDYDALRDEAAQLRTAQAPALPDLMPVITWLENGCDPKEAAKELRIYRDRALSPQPATPALSDEDLWHIAGVVSSFDGGSLFNVSERECVTAIRASFMDPDAGRALLAKVRQIEPQIIPEIIPAPSGPVPNDTYPALERIAEKLKAAGAKIPIEVQGTIESGIRTGLSTALFLVEEELDLLSKVPQ